jgi:hypothetical protein
VQVALVEDLHDETISAFVVGVKERSN